MRFSAVSYACAAAVLLGLAACSGGNDTSVTLSASEASAADASVSAAAGGAQGAQTLNSSDGKISIVVGQGQFADQMDHAADWVSADSVKSLTLLQRDDENDITLAVNALGRPELKADAYFDKLTKSLKGNKELEQLKVGMPTDNRMNYHFTHTVNDMALNENCVAIYGSDSLYTVCASSGTADDKQLAAVLKNIALKN